MNSEFMNSEFILFHGKPVINLLCLHLGISSLVSYIRLFFSLYMKY